MKVYLIHSKLLPENYKKGISSILESEGLELITRKTPTSYDLVDFNEAQNVLKENQKLIKACDIVVVELSVSSFAIGYFVSLAIEEKKPIIAIYNLNEFKEVSRKIERTPVTFKGFYSNAFIFKEYTLATLKGTLHLALKDIKKQLTSKFNLILPPEYDKYLEWNAKYKKSPKSETVRNLIGKAMKDDEDYERHLRSFKEI
jgi:hypothetical protein